MQGLRKCKRSSLFVCILWGEEIFVVLMQGILVLKQSKELKDFKFMQNRLLLIFVLWDITKSGFFYCWVCFVYIHVYKCIYSCEICVYIRYNPKNMIISKVLQVYNTMTCFCYIGFFFCVYF